MKVLKKMLLLSLGGLCLATSLMLLVNALPNNKMKEHVKESAVVMEKEGDYPRLMEGFFSSQLDNFTDSIMLVSSVHKERKGLIDQAMNVYRVRYGDAYPSEVLIKYTNGEGGVYSLAIY